MNNADVQEMLWLAIQAKESGFPRIQADPADIIEVFEQRNQLLEALQLLFYDYKELADSGDAGNWALENQREGIIAMAALERAKGESK